MKRIATLLAVVWLLHPCIAAKATSEADTNIQFYFWNEVTGDVQWEDPGGVPNAWTAAALACDTPT